jgi:hypothetical protein
MPAIASPTAFLVAWNHYLCYSILSNQAYFTNLVCSWMLEYFNLASLEGLALRWWIILLGIQDYYSVNHSHPIFFIPPFSIVLFKFQGTHFPPLNVNLFQTGL